VNVVELIQYVLILFIKLNIYEYCFSAQEWKVSDLHEVVPASSFGQLVTGGALPPPLHLPSDDKR